MSLIQQASAQGFSPEVFASMMRVYEEASETLKLLPPWSNPITECAMRAALARAIIELVREGESDERRLYRKALLQIAP